MKKKYLIIHCSATRCSRAYTPEQLDADHRARGFRCAGYYYYIRRNGDIVRMRPETEIGAHAKGYNENSIGICYEGGLNEKGKPSDTRTKEQRNALDFLLDILVFRYPGVQIVGHRDLSKDRNGDGEITPDEWEKYCPCFHVKRVYARLNDLSKMLAGV